MRSMMMTVVAAAVCGLAGVSEGQGTNLIVNGSFEKGAWTSPWLPLVNGSTQVTGWMVTCQTGSSCGDYLQNWAPFAPDGIRFVDFQGQPGQHLGLTQIVSTQPGIDHLITLQFSGGIFVGDPNVNGVARHIGIEIDGQQTILECITCDPQLWELISFSFTPSTSQTTIRLFSPEWLNDVLPTMPWVDDVRLITDCNGNGIHDGDEIASGTEADANGDGILDVCQPQPNPCIAADISPAFTDGTTGNGVVNIDDLVALLNVFGQTSPPGGPTVIGDINGNGVVNIDDLVGVLNSFGPCP